MIPAIFDRWVHPWRRPAEDRRSVRLSAPVRVVSPVPPHEPEPLPDEPFAPVYEFVPLSATESFTYNRYDRYPPKGTSDAVVFGPQYALGGHSVVPDQYCPCGVSWALGTAESCWNCGRPA